MNYIKFVLPESILLTGVHTCIWAGTSNSQETGATDPYVDEIPSCHYCASKKNSKKYPQETKADSHGHQPAPDPWCNISRKNSTNSDTFVDKTDLKTSKINHLNHRSLHSEFSGELFLQIRSNNSLFVRSFNFFFTDRNVAICIVMAIVMVILLLFVAHAKLGKN